MSPLRITEIYASIQGEAAFSGYPCTFIRLTGCPLRCKWCDTVYGFEGGKDFGQDEILAKVAEFGLHHVELTGGEPLAQAGAIPLMQALVDRGHRVMIETGGSESIESIPQDVHIIMDIKCPGSGMVEKNRWANMDFLKPSDEIKFVVANREDFDWALDLVRTKKLHERCQVIFSCAFGLVQPKDLAEWMVEMKAPGRMQLQMHKYIWHPRAKGV
ncbi:radical SAM protein [bacterium]|nr:radical SAM protein [bacterium]